MRALAIVLALAAAALAGAAPARAQVPSPVGPIYPWCAQYGGAFSGGTNCYFAELWQCRQAVFGTGGWCYENPFSWSVPAAPPPRRKARRPSR